jgi:hypothetical protein
MVKELATAPAVRLEAVPVNPVPAPVYAPFAVTFPTLSTLNSLVPPIFKSSSKEAVPDAVFVTLTRRAASTTPVVFHVGNIWKAGRVCDPVSESVIVSGMAVDPASVVAANNSSLVPVAAVVSPKVKAV